MAKGDVKSSRGRGYVGGSYTEYDDEGRGYSKELWEKFRVGFEGSGFSAGWLYGLSDNYIHTFMQNTRMRYGVCDGPRIWEWDVYVAERGEEAVRKLHLQDDSRMARIIKKRLGDDAWVDFSIHFSEAFYRHKKDQDEKSRQRWAEWEEKAEVERAAREAESLKVRIEETTRLRQEVELTAGMLRSDFNDAFRYKEVHGLREGDWLDDPVSAYGSGYGWGEETRERSGVKLQVTVSLDTSNSMYHNGISEIARDAFREIYMTLEAIQSEHSADLFIAAFTFSQGDDGKGVDLHDNREYSWESFTRERVPRKPTDEYDLGAMERFREYRAFYGEDTWVYPLFEEIEKWEVESSDPGAVRLDIVITDAVLEHPKDIREASKIQERRDGSLQTVFLNLMPEEEWVDCTLPLRCVQYPADRDNLGGLLRNVLAEFVSIYV